MEKWAQPFRPNKVFHYELQSIAKEYSKRSTKKPHCKGEKVAYRMQSLRDVWMCSSFFRLCGTFGMKLRVCMRYTVTHIYLSIFNVHKTSGSHFFVSLHRSFFLANILCLKRTSRNNKHENTTYFCFVNSWAQKRKGAMNHVFWAMCLFFCLYS